ncbi:MAG: type I methionyl aminopeptidase [bacterium]|nr:type I methionyl aminopeptidase [bacterium]
MVTIKNEKEIKMMREGGKLLAQIMQKLIAEVKPGVFTGHLEKMACDLISQVGGRPSFKGYQSKYDSVSYPTALCASINSEVVHSPTLPSQELKQGDIIGLDLGMEYPFYANTAECGYYTDMAMTVPVGKTSLEAQKLIDVTREALRLGIEQILPGNTLNSIGRTIENYVRRNKFTVVRELVGHGVGHDVHEDPQVHNYNVAENNKIILKQGMVLAIEPMVNAGGWRIKSGKDGFSFLTADNSLSAHFEHSVLITKNGYEILTKYE